MQDGIMDEDFIRLLLSLGSDAHFCLFRNAHRIYDGFDAHLVLGLVEEDNRCQAKYESSKHDIWRVVLNCFLYTDKLGFEVAHTGQPGTSLQQVLRAVSTEYLLHKFAVEI